jgi:hypothetical protein
MVTNGTYADLYRRQSSEAPDGPEAKGSMSIPLTARAS